MNRHRCAAARRQDPPAQWWQPAPSDRQLSRLALPDPTPHHLFFDDFRLAGVGNTLRVTLGPLARGEARRLAYQCATLCQVVCGARLRRPTRRLANERTHISRQGLSLIHISEPTRQAE